jgi:hypothetical protein
METGSSATISLGLDASARAITTRWRWRSQPDLDQQLPYLHAHLVGGDVQVVGERAAQDVADPAGRIERRVRVLEDELHVAPVAVQLPAAELVDSGLPEQDGAGGGLVDRGDHPRYRCLAATALPDEAERGARLDREAHLVDGALAAGSGPAASAVYLGHRLEPEPLRADGFSLHGEPP